MASHTSSVALMWRLNEGRYNLVGTVCTTCNRLFFPPKALCPDCRRKGAIAPHKFSGKGVVESYTIIYSAPEGFERQVPYVVAVIKMDGDVKISGQIVGLNVPELVEKKVDLIGKNVVSTFRKYYDDEKDGLIQYGVKWLLE